MVGLVAYFCREEDYHGVLGQLFTEPRKFVFILITEEMLNAFNAEKFDVTWVDGFTFEHCTEASNCSNDDMRLFLEPLPILVNISPTNGEVGGDVRCCSSSGYKRIRRLCGLAGWAKDDCLSFFDGLVELVNDDMENCLRFSR